MMRETPTSLSLLKCAWCRQGGAADGVCANCGSQFCPPDCTCHSRISYTPDRPAAAQRVLG